MTTKQPITRAMYMADSSNLHHAYFLQSAPDRLIAYFKTRTGIIKRCRRSDQHLNAGFTLTEWDNLAITTKHMVDKSFILRMGECLSPATLVCITKETFRHIVNQLDSGGAP